MDHTNFTPLEIEYKEEKGGPLFARLKEYVKHNTSVVMVVGAFVLISTLAIATTVLVNVKERQDIARAKAEEEHMLLVSAKQNIVESITPTIRLSVTRPPSRTPTPSPRATLTPTQTSTPTHTTTPTITPTITLYPTATPTLTHTPTHTLTPTQTHTPTLTFTPSPTTDPGSCTCAGGMVTGDTCTSTYTATCSEAEVCVCNPPTP